jgi:hypothetical protein
MYEPIGDFAHRPDHLIGAMFHAKRCSRDEPPVLGSLPENPERLIDPLTGWYRRWYFLVRLDDAIELARREDRELSLVLLRLPLTLGGLPPVGNMRLRQELLFAGHWSLHLNDLPGALNDEELAVFLPDSGFQRAARVAAKLEERLFAFTPEIGTAVFPDDGWTVDQLISCARARARRFT